MTEPSGSTTDLNALIRQAEIQQKRMQLEVQFQKNMELFKQFAPTIYRDYINYTPDTLHLSYTEEGYLNLVNSQSGNPVYDRDPEEFCAKQFQQFVAHPTKYRIGFTRPSDEHFFQRIILNDMMEAINDEFMPEANLEKPIGVMVINGCGLGFHIPQIIETFDIYTLIINEPTKDSFYASLHTIDWAPIVNAATRKGRLLKLYISNQDEHTIHGIRLLTNRIGMHNITNTYFFSHLSGPKNDQFAAELKRQFHLTLTGVGFLEDEQISIAHTVTNTNDNIPILNANRPLKDLPPAFVIGNGPSLDKSIPYIKAMQDKAIIVSCGSTLATLQRNNIVPDYHVEMERTFETCVPIENLTTEEFRKDITLVALNTVMPRTMALFDKKLMAMKPNDASEEIIKDMYGADTPPISGCNPTCTNMGLSLLLYLGFDEIYLHGTDLGMRNADQHHSKSSYYYDPNNKIATDTNTNIKTEGNFGGEVYTTAILSTSNANMSAIIQQCDVKVYNTSDGAKIPHTIPLPVEDIDLGQSQIDKGALKKKISEYNFSQKVSSEELNGRKIKKKYLREFYKLRDFVKLRPDIKNIGQLQKELDNIHLKVHDLKDTAPTTYWLLNGSIQTFFTVVFNNALCSSTDEEFKQNYKTTSTIYNDFIDRCYKLMEEHGLTHDCEDPTHRRDQSTS